LNHGFGVQDAKTVSCKETSINGKIYFIIGSNLTFIDCNETKLMLYINSIKVAYFNYYIQTIN